MKEEWGRGRGRGDRERQGTGKTLLVIELLKRGESLIE